LLVSVADIAKRLYPRDDQDADKVREKLRERIMHWTRSGTLGAFNAEMLGKGTPRLFEHGSIVRAAVLSQMTDMGVDCTTWEHALMACEQAREAARLWANGDTRPRWLEIKWIAGHPFSVRGLPEVIERVGDRDDPTLSGVVLINLKQMFQGIAWTPQDELEDESLEAPKFKRAARQERAAIQKSGKKAQPERRSSRASKGRKRK
jgi:hypothetical protein